MKTEFSAHAIQSIRKRNGAIVPFNPEKIARAIARAGEEPKLPGFMIAM